MPVGGRPPDPASGRCVVDAGPRARPPGGDLLRARRAGPIVAGRQDRGDPGRRLHRLPRAPRCAHDPRARWRHRSARVRSARVRRERALPAARHVARRQPLRRERSRLCERRPAPVRPRVRNRAARAASDNRPSRPAAADDRQRRRCRADTDGPSADRAHPAQPREGRGFGRRPASSTSTYSPASCRRHGTATRSRRRSSSCSTATALR